MILISIEGQDGQLTGSDTVDVIRNSGVAAVWIVTRLVFHELLEPILSQLFVFDVVGFVFLCTVEQNETQVNFPFLRNQSLVKNRDS